uniref:Ubiquitin associated protein 1 like n=1 Tax=Chelonoidis abingdonii TaxID=106734 RepID=A0A8C0H8N0_CHEAB
MSCLDDVPFKMSKSFEDDSAEGTNLISLADFDIPDCTEILMCTMHDFSLERKVLYWIEAASGQETPWYEVTTDVVPTAPPCWLCVSLSAADLKYGPPLNKEEENILDNKFFRPRTSPVLLDPPSKNYSALVHPLNRSSRNLRYGPASDVSFMRTLTPTPPPTPCCSPRTPAAARSIPPIRNHKPTIASLSPYCCLPPPSAALQHPSSHRTHPDSTADLLSALSQEERDLIEPVIALGYPIRRAILALQKTGRQSLGQFLSYLSACDRLLKQGYEEGQVEEAMEMFQYSEKKAAEFLHLLVQFKDMGFQQAEIKEVLLLYENHRDKALEELMTRTQ